MTTCQHVGASFTKISPITLGQSALRIAPLTQTDHRNKELKQALSHVFSILSPLAELNQADNQFIRINLVALRDLTQRILEEVNRLAPTPNNQLFEKVKALNNSINLEITSTALNQMKGSLTLALKMSTHDKTIQQTLEALEKHKKTFIPKFQGANELYPEVLAKCQNLAYIIDNLARKPRPKKEMEDSFVYRSNGALTQSIVQKFLDEADEAEVNSTKDFKELIKEWNFLSYKLNEINWLTKALDIINLPMTSLAEERKKIDKIEKQISAIKNATQIFEQCLVKKFDPEVNVSITLPQEKPNFKEIETNLRNVTENIGRLNLLIHSTLEALKTPVNKDFHLQTFEIEIRDFFVASNEKANALFKSLEKEISSAFESCKFFTKKAGLELNLLKETNEFIGDLALLSLSVHQLTKTLRDARKEAIVNKYDSAFSKAKTDWSHICKEVNRLSSSHVVFTRKLTALNKLEDDGEQKESSEDLIVLLPGEAGIVSTYLEQLTTLTKAVTQCWTVNLPEICNAAALELNLGAEALASKDQHPQKFSEAFPSKTGYKLTTAMRSSFSESQYIPNYQSPFETLPKHSS